MQLHGDCVFRVGVSAKALGAFVEASTTRAGLQQRQRERSSSAAGRRSTAGRRSSSAAGLRSGSRSAKPVTAHQEKPFVPPPRTPAAFKEGKAAEASAEREEITQPSNATPSPSLGVLPLPAAQGSEAKLSPMEACESLCQDRCAAEPSDAWEAVVAAIQSEDELQTTWALNGLVDTLMAEDVVDERDNDDDQDAYDDEYFEHENLCYRQPQPSFLAVS